MDKLFTIIMPNYNKGKYISEAIESVLNQTYTLWELIIVDDGSTDDSIEKITSYLNQNKNITLVRNKSQKGISYSMRRGLKLAKGYVVGTLDSDDVLLDNALEYMIQLHTKHEDHSLIVSTINLHDENMKFIAKEDSLPLLKPGETLFSKRGETVEYYVKNRQIKFISMSFRTFKLTAYKQIKGYDTSLPTAEDVDVMYQLEKVGKVMFTDDVVYNRRVVSNSMTNMNGNILRIYNDYFRAECKEIKRIFGRFIPFCNFVYFPSVMILYFNHWFKQYRKDSNLLLSDLFLRMSFKVRKQSRLLSQYYLFIGKKLKGV